MFFLKQWKGGISSLAENNRYYQERGVLSKYSRLVNMFTKCNEYSKYQLKGFILYHE
jgi:hypothetical protein